MSKQVLDNIRTRRVIRHMTHQPVKLEQLEQILDAGRWAPNGGNLRPHRFVVVQDTLTLRLIRMVAPGMFQQPPALIILCIDWDVVAFHKLPPSDRALYVDVGTAAENMMLAAHALGLATGPVTSYSKEAVRVILNLPQNFTPEMCICVGHAKKIKQSGVRAWKTITWKDLTYWERFPEEG